VLSRRRFLLAVPAVAAVAAIALRQGEPVDAAECCTSPDLPRAGFDPAGAAPSVLSQADKFGLPFRTPPGPDTWLLGQGYGNTTGAFNQRRTQYGAGQGLHFGLDFSCPCGTPVVAIGDGVVNAVDGPYGSAPHNVMIDHGNGYSSLYGHLVERSTDVRVGQRVQKGQVIGRSGDSQFTCYSAPHLHLEIRNAAKNRAYNPIPLIDADWPSLALIGSFNRGFARDLTDPRRWQHVDEQPEVIFGGRLLNDYQQSWPPDRSQR
jgi:murein DD-endopeptidase MepM/ murein hydrolase activator NlpD